VYGRILCVALWYIYADTPALNAVVCTILVTKCTSCRCFFDSFVLSGRALQQGLPQKRLLPRAQGSLQALAWMTCFSRGGYCIASSMRTRTQICALMSKRLHWSSVRVCICAYVRACLVLVCVCVCVCVLVCVCVCVCVCVRV